MPYVYIVRCADGTLYTGWATDVERRVKAHNTGRGARYTRLRGPVELVYAEAVPSRSAAQQREHEIKRWSRAQKLALCGLPPTAGPRRSARARRGRDKRRAKRG